MTSVTKLHYVTVELWPPWRSWRCFWLRNHISQGKAVALVTTRTCVSSEQKGRHMQACFIMKGSGTVYEPHLSKRWLLPKGQKPGDCFRGPLKASLCHVTDTQRDGPQAGGNISELLFFSLSLPRVAYMEFFHCAYEPVLKLLQENHYFN